MAKALKARIAKAELAVHAAMNAIYAVTPRTDLLFSECCALAPHELLKAYDAALDERWRAEQAAVDAGKAYRGAFGQLVWKV